MTDESYNSRYVLFEWKDGILIATFHPDVRYVDREMAEEIVRDRLKFQGILKNVCVLIKASGPIEISESAQQYFSSAEGIRGLAATAIVTQMNPVIRFWYEWFKHVMQPKMGLKSFSTEAKAKAWLKGKMKTVKI